MFHNTKIQKVAVVDFENFYEAWRRIKSEFTVETWINQLSMSYDRVILVGKVARTWPSDPKTSYIHVAPESRVDFQSLNHGQKSYDDCYCVYLTHKLHQHHHTVHLITKDKLRGLEIQAKYALRVLVHGNLNFKTLIQNDVKRYFTSALITKKVVEEVKPLIRSWSHNFQAYELNESLQKHICKSPTSYLTMIPTEFPTLKQTTGLYCEQCVQERPYFVAPPKMYIIQDSKNYFLPKVSFGQGFCEKHVTDALIDNYTSIFPDPENQNAQTRWSQIQKVLRDM